MSASPGLPSYFDERDWLSGDDPHPMLDFLAVYYSATKLPGAVPGERLARTLARFQLACLELVADHIVGEETRRVVATLQRFVDRAASQRDVVAAADVARRFAEDPSYVRDFAERVTMDVVHNAAFRTGAPRDMFVQAANVSIGVTLTIAMPPAPGDDETSQQRQSRLKDETRLVLARRLREVVGNPFRRPPFQLAWRTPTVLRLAQSAYESGDFSILPILADAVEEEGGDDELTQHLRHGGPHHRYCWALADVLDTDDTEKPSPE